MSIADDRAPGFDPDDFDLVVTDVEYVIDRAPNPSWRIREFANPRSEILACAVSGRAHYRIGDAAHEIRGGDVLVLPRGAVHAASSDRDEPWHFVSVAFSVAGGRDRAAPDFARIPSVTQLAGTDTARLFQDMYAAYARRSPGYLLQVRGLVSLVLHRLVTVHGTSEPQRQVSRRMRAVTDLLLDHVDRTYSVDELAAVAGLSTSRFRALFKDATGVTATRFQQRLKIEKATEYLTSGEYNVSETARATGFRDVFYFSHLYKRVTGLTPSSVMRGDDLWRPRSDRSG